MSESEKESNRKRKRERIAKYKADKELDRIPEETRIKMREMDKDFDEDFEIPEGSMNFLLEELEYWQPYIQEANSIMLEECYECGGKCKGEDDE